MKPVLWRNANSLPLALLICGVLFDAVTLAYPPLSLGPADGLRMRLFRLARVAAVALPLLAVFLSSLAARVENATARRARHAMIFGAAAMPLILTAAALTRIELRLLLPLPALAVVYAAFSASLLARRAHPAELWGWRLVAASTAAGLVMGLYAFDAPLLGDFAGAYDGTLRAAIRGAHESAVLSGMTLIFLCQAFAKKGAADEDRTHRYRGRQAADA